MNTRLGQIAFPRGTTRGRRRPYQAQQDQAQRAGSGPERASSSAPCIHTMCPCHSDHRPLGAGRAGNFEPFQDFLDLSGTGRVAQGDPVTRAPATNVGWRAGFAGLRAKVETKKALTSPGIGSSRGEDSAELRLVGGPVRPGSSRSSRGVRSAEIGPGSASRCPARPSTASRRRLYVASKLSETPSLPAA